MINLLEKVTVPLGEKGNFIINKVNVQRDVHWMRDVLDGRGCVPGEYTRLIQKDYGVIMSDTTAEMSDHYVFTLSARGQVLVAGMGIGLILHNLAKVERVEHITVVEKYQDVIDLVGDHYKKMYGDRITIICADIYEYKPTQQFDYGWFDIWNSIEGDNCKEFSKINKLFKKHVVERYFWAEKAARRLHREQLKEAREQAVWDAMFHPKYPLFDEMASEMVLMDGVAIKI